MELGAYPLRQSVNMLRNVSDANLLPPLLLSARIQSDGHTFLIRFHYEHQFS